MINYRFQKEPITTLITDGVKAFENSLIAVMSVDTDVGASLSELRYFCPQIENFLDTMNDKEQKLEVNLAVC